MKLHTEDAHDEPKRPFDASDRIVLTGCGAAFIALAVLAALRII